jgi:hypothetical protein
MSRGNARQDIVTNDYDRLQILSSFVHVINRIGLFCHAYCRMGQ